jgi:hypothetical protein
MPQESLISESLSVSEVKCKGTVADGSAVSDAPILVAGQDGTNVQSLKTDSTGRIETVSQGAAADGAAVSGNPVLVAGQDGTNAQSLSTDSDGVLKQVPTKLTTGMSQVCESAGDSTTANITTFTNIYTVTAGKTLYLTGITIAARTDASGTAGDRAKVSWRTSTSENARWQVALPAASSQTSVHITFPVPIECAANDTIDFATEDGNCAISCTITGWEE